MTHREANSRNCQQCQLGFNQILLLLLLRKFRKTSHWCQIWRPWHEIHLRGDSAAKCRPHRTLIASEPQISILAPANHFSNIVPWPNDPSPILNSEKKANLSERKNLIYIFLGQTRVPRSWVGIRQWLPCFNFDIGLRGHFAHLTNPTSWPSDLQSLWQKRAGDSLQSTSTIKALS